MPGLSQRAYARHRGTTHRAVQKAIEDGRIAAAVGQDGKIDPVLADRLWAANTDPTKASNSVTGDPKHRKASPEAPPTPAAPAAVRRQPRQDAAGDAGAPLPAISPEGFHKARTVRETFQAKLAQLEFQQRSGQLVNADEVKLTMFNAARAARNALMQLPDRLAPVLAGMEDPADVRDALRKEIRILCEQLARAATYEPEQEPAPPSRKAARA